jgi:antibiotic biosynthesis monooxygenase (ABM) superfamily enzyme
MSQQLGRMSGQQHHNPIKKGGRIMVLFVQKWDVAPGKLEEYNEWIPSAMKRCLSAPGVIELRGYKPAIGSQQSVVTWEFADLESWAKWHSDEELVKVRAEFMLLTTNRMEELWGPSPIIPKPIRPGA